MRLRVVRVCYRVGEQIPLLSFFLHILAETCKDCPVEPLHLPVGLRVVSGGVEVPDSQDVADVLKEFRGELPAIIRE